MQFIEREISPLLIYNLNNELRKNENKDEEILDIIFNTTNSTSIYFSISNEEILNGSRLGIPYNRSQQNDVEVNINNHIYKFNQSPVGLMAISSVLWDAGLLMTDFLVHYNNLYNITKNNNKILNYNVDNNNDKFIPFLIQPLGNVLDIGCGVGIAGITALILNCESVVLTDCIETDCLIENIDTLLQDKKHNVKFVEYNWLENNIPKDLLYNTSNTELNSDDNIKTFRVWDTILCSDVLYGAKFSKPLLRFITNLRFQRLILSYKKR